MPRNFFFAAFFVAAAALVLWPAPGQAAPAYGSLVKIADNSAVYLYGSDGNRHAFPNEKIFYSWFTDFAGVQVLSPTELAALPLGKNITYRPGSRLVKITTDPKVYAVQDGGLLRSIASESDAASLFGAAWAQRIDDVPDTFFFDYQVTGEVTSGTWPDGTVVKSTSGTYYLISDGLKRRLTGSAESNLSRFAVADAGGRIASIVEGAELTAYSRPYSEVAMVYPDVPTFRAITPPSSYVASGREVTLAEFRLSTSQAVAVTKMNFRIEALRDEDSGQAVDDDFGVLIYGNSVRKNLSNLRVTNAAGQTLLGPAELAVDIDRDESQTIQLRGSAAVSASSEQPLYLKATLNEGIPDSEPYRATLLKSETEVVSGNAARTFLPAGDIVAPFVTARTMDVKMTVSANDSRAVRGTKGVELGRFDLLGGASDGWLKSFIATGYLDSESTGGFLIGGDADGGLEVRVRQMVPTVSLYLDGQKIAGPTEVNWSGQAIFANLNQLIAAGKTSILTVVGDIPALAPTGSVTDILAFDVISAASQVKIENSSGQTIDVRGDSPNYLNASMRRYVRIQEHGSLRFKWQAAGGTIIAGQVATLGTLTLTAKDDGYKVTALGFWQTGGDFPPQSFPDVDMTYVATDGTTKTKRLSTNMLQLNFSDLDIKVGKDSTATVTLKAVSLPQSAGAKYAEVIGVRFDPTLLMQFESVTNQAKYSQTNLGGSESSDFYADAGAVSKAEIRFGDIRITASGGASGKIARDNDAATLGFAVTAVGSRARIKTLTVRLTPGDAGTFGSNNDSLEKWARLDVGLDANSVGDLVRVMDGNETIVGEDSSVTISYVLYKNGSRAPDPLVDSSAGSFAKLVYTWKDGSEYSISAGETAYFVYRLDTTKFWQSVNFSENRDYSLSVSLDASPDFYWTDDPGINYTPRSSTGTGLPITGAYTVSKP